MFGLYVIANESQRHNGSLGGNGPLKVRRVPAKNGECAADCLEYRDAKIRRNPFSKEKWKLAKWAPLPNVEQLAQSQAWQHASGALSKQLEKMSGLPRPPVSEDTISISEFGRFLHRAGLIAPSPLQASVVTLGESSQEASRAFALSLHQAAAAVGTYFQDNALLAHLPSLGTLMGTPSKADIKNSIVFSTLASTVAARGLAEALPENRPVCIEFVFQGRDRSKLTQSATGREFQASSEADLFVRIKDANTEEVLQLVPLAFETRQVDTATNTHDIRTTRTTANMMLHSHFERTDVAQFTQLSGASIGAPVAWKSRHSA